MLDFILFDFRRNGCATLISVVLFDCGVSEILTMMPIYEIVMPICRFLANSHP